MILHEERLTSLPPLPAPLGYICDHFTNGEGSVTLYESPQVSAFGYTYCNDPVFTADQLLDAEIATAFEYCRTNNARIKAAECRDRAHRELEHLRQQFIAAVRETAATPIQ